MSHRISQLSLFVLLASLTGCAMCANPFDCQYGAYGSRLPRADMTYGRVGSILDGSNGGIVTTQPMSPEPLYDEYQSSGSELILDDSQPAEAAELYESPSTTLEQLPASEQLDRVYENIEGEIGD